MNKTVKKTTLVVILGYLVYGIAIWLYLFHFSPVGIPSEYAYTAADPATFMTSEQLATSTTFARTRHLLFFLSTPFEWLVIFYFMFGGMSCHLEEVMKARISRRPLQVTVYYFMFALFTFLAMLPIRFISYQLARFYGISMMTLPHWLRNRGLDFVIDLVLMLIIVQVVLFLAQKFKKKWWLITWVAFIPFAFFFMLIQPVLIAPLYHDFYPIRHPDLEAQILAMAEVADVSVDRVFEVQMSDRTNLVNGYVTGVGPTARIVLWDTALQQLEENEIMFLMAHEIAHYVYRDVYRGIAFAIAFAFGGLFVVYKVVDKMEAESLRRIPMALVTVSILMFAVSPVTNAISRRIERRADTFALEMTEDPEAGIGLFQHFARTALNEGHPPGLVRIFRSTHPSTFERIIFLMEE